MAHPTQNKERLMNKILSQIMIHCRDHINAEQVQVLQIAKESPSDFDSINPTYAALLNFSLDKYDVSSLPEDQ